MFVNYWNKSTVVYKPCSFYHKQLERSFKILVVSCFTQMFVEILDDYAFANSMFHAVDGTPIPMVASNTVFLTWQVLIVFFPVSKKQIIECKHGRLTNKTLWSKLFSNIMLSNLICFYSNSVFYLWIHGLAGSHRCQLSEQLYCLRVMTAQVLWGLVGKKHVNRWLVLSVDVWDNALLRFEANNPFYIREVNQDCGRINGSFIT